MYRILTMGLICLAAAAPAQQGPSFDCADAQSSAEELICANPEMAELDRRLTERYAEALTAAQTLSAGAGEAEAGLRSEQRGWIKARDGCWKADDLHACVEAAYLERDAVLVTTWMLQEPIATDVWQCGDTAANEVVTLYFDTPLPSVRMERGDTIDSGVLQQTASGSKYEGSFGRSIWIKGDDATYREADPDGAEYSCSRAK